MSNDKDKVEIFEDEKGVLLDHNYDGIRELNHPLPMWWVVVFIGTIVFGIPYYLYYEHMGGPSLDEQLAADMAVIHATQDAKKKKEGGFNLDEFNAYVSTPKAKKAGKKNYRRKCKACHGAQGEGGIGPNLADKYWLHGDGTVESIYKTVDKGVTDKGMPAWGGTLGKKKVMAVVQYIKEFQGTKPENAKAPQGIEIK